MCDGFCTFRTMSTLKKAEAAGAGGRRVHSFIQGPAQGSTGSGMGAWRLQRVWNGCVEAPRVWNHSLLHQRVWNNFLEAQKGLE